jgi:hypothetical protein
MEMDKMGYTVPSPQYELGRDDYWTRDYEDRVQYETEERGEMTRVELMTRKGIFCYDYCTGVEQMFETGDLPPIEKFHNLLTDQDVSAEDYEHAQKVWYWFECRHLMDYCMVYCVSDVLLLADAIHHTRTAMFRQFGMDMLHYLSFPMMAKDVLLKTTKAEMELISDAEAVGALRNNLRGGLSFVNTRLVELERAAVNPSTPDQTGLTFKGKHASICYFDCNNLYGG